MNAHEQVKLKIVAANQAARASGWANVVIEKETQTTERVFFKFLNEADGQHVTRRTILAIYRFFGKRTPLPVKSVSLATEFGSFSFTEQVSDEFCQSINR